MTVRSPIRIAPGLAIALIVAACSTASAPPSASPLSSSAPSTPASVSTAPSSSTAPVPSTSPAASSSPEPSPSVAAETLLLKVTSEGGFIGPSATLAALPLVVVYSDGRIFSPAPQDAIYPGPLLPAFQVRDVGPTGAAAITKAVRSVGLDSPAPSDNGVAADTGTTVITAVLDGVTTTARFPGLGGAPGRPNAGGGNPAAAAAKALLDRLNDPTDDWGGTAGPQSIYTPAGYRIFVAPGGPPPDAQASQSPMTWPLTTPLADFGTPAVPDRGIAGLRSGVVLGDDATALTPFLSKANALTPIVSGGKAYTIYVRPLLPDESGGG